MPQTRILYNLQQTKYTQFTTKPKWPRLYKMFSAIYLIGVLLRVVIPQWNFMNFTILA